MVGAITLSLVPVIIKSRIGAASKSRRRSRWSRRCVAIGSLLAALLSHGRIELAPAPFLLLIMGVFAIDLGAVTSALAPTTDTVASSFFGDAADGGSSRRARLFLRRRPVRGADLRRSAELAGEDRRARVIGAVNTLNSIYMVVGSLATTLLLSWPASASRGDGPARRRQFRRRDLSLPPPAGRLPGFALRTLWRVFLRLEVVGIDALPPPDRSTSSLSITSRCSTPIILSLLNGRPLLVVDAALARRWWIRQFLRLCDARLLDPPIRLRRASWSPGA